MDLAQAFGVPEDVEIGGRRLAFRQLTLAEWAPLQGWLKSHFPSPVTLILQAIEEAKALGMPLSPSTRDDAISHAVHEARNWPPAFGSRAWLAAMGGVTGGTVKFLQHVATAAGLELSDKEAEAIVIAATTAELDELCRVVYYGDPPSPKTQAPTEAGETSAPTIGAHSFTSSPKPAVGRTKKSAG